MKEIPYESDSYYVFDRGYNIFVIFGLAESFHRFRRHVGFGWLQATRGSSSTGDNGLQGGNTDTEGGNTDLDGSNEG